MIAPGCQIFQITPNWKKKPLTLSQGHLEELSFKVLCDVILLSLPGHIDIPYFVIIASV